MEIRICGNPNGWRCLPLPSPFIGTMPMTGTELQIITPAAPEVLDPEVHRLATLHTNAKTGDELLKVWLKSHQDGSPHTIRVYERIGERFLGALAAAGSDLRKAAVEDVQAALAAMRSKVDGSPVRPAPSTPMWAQ